MTESDTRARVLDAAEALMRRHGPDKLSVTDVGRALGVSHAAVYRYVPSKKALVAALVERWLKRVSAPLHAIAVGEGPAEARLRAWARELHRLKRAKIGDDPEIFAAYARGVADYARDVAVEHVAELVGQVRTMLADGAAEGVLMPDAPNFAEAVFTALAPFSAPSMVIETGGADRTAEQETVLDLLLRGLKA